MRATGCAYGYWAADNSANATAPTPSRPLVGPTGRSFRLAGHQRQEVELRETPRRSIEHLASQPKHNHAVGDLLHHAHVVCDQDHGDPRSRKTGDHVEN